MRPPHVLVLTSEDDPHAERVCDLLARRGARVSVFDPGDFPVHAKVDLGYGAGTGTRRILREKETIDLDTVSAVWWRRPTPPRPHAEIVDPAVAAHTVQECKSLLSDLWEQLPCRQVPARESVFRRSGQKSSQLALAAELGFAIPETLISTDAESFLDFHDRHDGRVITKAFHVPFVEGVGDDGLTMTRLTEPVSPRDLAYADGLRFCPVIVQEMVPKRVELRVTIVGRRIFAAEIHSQASNRSSLDWRYYDTRTTPHRPHRLQEEIADRCLALMDRLGLLYGAVDLIVTPDDRHVFLEVNPNAQWLWVENMTGLPISEAVCDLLLEPA
ncbi:MvdC/MvdD family ATP grasp protein [Microbispora sp. GKU 823]|uniref:MvdC/MvdD family ATP grasp protein n=1 Tax=Microbispora sp. GKU 823 TaxID=1652100 RepID=UPI0009A2D32F|nr:hypothetical protein [Microbispora sp. GKU 823]OPG12005.1 hypothetical protein B1L11_16710 [Microbispora sp. GKU 823]